MGVDNVTGLQTHPHHRPAAWSWFGLAGGAEHGIARVDARSVTIGRVMAAAVALAGLVLAAPAPARPPNATCADAPPPSGSTAGPGPGGGSFVFAAGGDMGCSPDAAATLEGIHAS